MMGNIKSALSKLYIELLLMKRHIGLNFTIMYSYLILKNFPEILRTRSLGIVDNQVRSLVRVHCQGHQLTFLPVAMSAIRELILKNCYGFSMARTYETVLDVGANQGVFTAMAAKVSNIVLSVESNKAELPELYRRTMELNHISNSHFINKFASDITSNETISLNTIIDEYNIKEISFLKIDIEGAEESLFKNNLEWLRLTKEISIEVHPCFGVDEQKIILLLNRSGFRVSLLDKDLNEIESLKTNSMGYIRANR